MSDVDVSLGLPPTSMVPELFRYAEKLGYTQGYVFDTAFQGDDLWYQLHRAAEVTTTMRLGPGAVHQGHLLRMSDADAAAWRAGSHALLPGNTMTGAIEDFAAAIRALVDAGATEIQFQPTGPDIPRELERFMAAARQA